MKRTKKYFALLMALFLLAALLAGCGSKQCVWCGKSFSGAGHDTGAGYVCDDCYNSLSGGTGSSSKSNTGVWIAVTVMVFIAVFSATSGVVYLVLQKVLPQEQPVSRRPRAREEDYDYEEFQAPRPTPPRPTGSAAPRPSANSGVWICPRDRSRNTGPYCSVCGANRPTAPQRPQNSQQGVRQNPARPQGPGSFVRPQQSNPPVQQPTPARPQQAPARPQQAAPVRPQQPAAPVYRSTPQQPAQPADWQMIPEMEQTPAPEKEYRGRFARRETPEQPEEVDSELLAAIFREAAEGSDTSFS